jgi:hypothetical protein
MKRAILLIVGVVAVAIVAVVAFRGSASRNAETPLPAETGSAVASTPMRPVAPVASAPPSAPSAVSVASGEPVDLPMALIAANRLSSAKAALAAGDPKKALADIESYEKLPDATPLKQETAVLKIEALSKIPGRKTDALALAMSTRDDPSFASYQPQINALLHDAGVLAPPPVAPP